MAVPIILPRQGQSVESCIIGEWIKKAGDPVKAGDILFTYETDKATFEEEAKTEGTLLAIFYDKGEDVPCLTNVGVIGNPGEDFTSFDPRAGASPVTDMHAVEPVSDGAQVLMNEFGAPLSPEVNTKAPAAISPRAKAAGERMKADASQALPTGPHGRIIERDVIRLAQEEGRFHTPSNTSLTSAPAEAPTTAPASDPGLTVHKNIEFDQEVQEYEDIKLRNIRKIIAKSMHESLTKMAQLTNNTSFDTTSIAAFRKQLKASAEKMKIPGITYTDIILFAVSRILLKHRDLNAHFLDDKIRYFRHVHLGIATDTPRGLMVPTLFNADTKSLREIALEAKALAKAAQDGNISPDLLTGGTFTVSNLGTLGIESFTPVINPPQTGILGVNCITERIRTIDGVITSYPSMGLSLTYDHRAIDGAPASRFLMELKDALESFPVLLVG